LETLAARSKGSGTLGKALIGLWFTHGLRLGRETIDVLSARVGHFAILASGMSRQPISSSAIVHLP
jgi:hypothetical protein